MMRQRNATERKVRAGFAFALACLVVIGIFAILSVLRAREDVAWVEHTHQVIRSLESLLATVTHAESGQRGFVITGNESYLEPFRRAAQAREAHLQTLRQLTADNPAQQRRLEALAARVAERFAILDEVIEVRRAQGFEEAQRLVLAGEGKRVHDQIRALVDEAMGEEEGVLREREARALESGRLTLFVIIGGSVLAFGVVALALVAIRRDFAGRQRAEAELQRFFDLSLDFLCISSADGYFKRVSPAVTDVLGWSVEEFLSRPYLDFVHPEDVAATTREVERQVVSGEKVMHFENRYRHRDGSWRVLSWRSMPQPDGLMYATARDVTELKRAEHVMRELNESLETRVQERTGELGQANQKLRVQLSQLALLSEITRAIGERQDVGSIFQVVVQTLEEHMPVDFACICQYDPAAVKLRVTSVGSGSMPLAERLALTRDEQIVIDQNGLSRCVRGRLVYEPNLESVRFAFPQRLAAAGLHAMVAAPLLVESQVFGVVITARRQANSFSSTECEFLRQLSEHVALAAHQAQLHSALLQAYDDLRTTQQAVMQQERLMALGQMASGIAHDINNAISPVALYTESLLEKEPNLTPRAREYLETIQRAIDDVAQTVARMREFYRQREPQVSLVAVDINTLVQQVVDLTRARWSDMAQQRGVSIEMRKDLAPNLPPIRAAENEIREALINLVFNAVDAMPAGGPLTVRTRAAGNEVQVDVIDSGVGMDQDTRRRCLEPFFTTKGERGTGLGLAMVYGSMQRHGANIEIDSEVGKGTTVRLSFPIVANVAAGASERKESYLPPPMRILVVDDDPTIVKTLHDTLSADGHSVTTANGGQAGIDAFLAAHSQGKAFPVVITDLGMPHVDGRKVSAAIKRAAPSTLVLMLTGWGQRLVAEGDVPEHVDRVLNKPPKLRDLREALTLESRE